MKVLHYILIATLVSTSCSQQKQTGDEAEQPAAELCDVTLTTRQASSLHFQTGQLSKHNFAGLTEANGTLAVMPQSEALVCPYIGANVKAILVKVGQTVRKGQVLATLSHPDLIELQSRYLTAYNRLSFVKEEYERQQKLSTEGINATKNYQQIRSEYKTLQAELSTTAQQLQMLGISVSTLQNGKTVNSISIHAPISGTVESIDVSTGQYANSETPMFHIVNTDNIYADLLVFEKDVPKVKVGQRVHLNLKSTTGADYMGKVYSVGKTFESNPKAVHVRVSIEGSHEGLITGMYLCGKIESERQSLLAIPSDGVVEEEGRMYIFSASNLKGHCIYHPIEVQKGREENGWTEITLPTGARENATYALNNAYYILSEMKKNETGEDE